MCDNVCLFFFKNIRRQGRNKSDDDEMKKGDGEQEGMR